MPDQIKTPPESHPGSLELTEEIIRLHAYKLFEQRGYEHGHDVEDWLIAEAEVIGKQPAVSVHEESSKQSMATAA